MQENEFSQKTAVHNTQRKSRPPVSVIVTTKNEEKNINNCLRSIKDQTFKNIELIVVDNYSKDKTAEIAKRYANAVYLKGSERSSQRNYGADVSNGEYLLFLDADMILSPNVIDECVRKCKTEKVDALYIPERIVGEGFWIKVRDFERSFYTGTVIDAIRFVRKDLFKNIGGFDEDMIGPEDWDLDRRIRKAGKTRTIKAALYHNEGNFDLERYLAKKEHYTRGINDYAEKWGHKNPETMKQLGIGYRLIGVFVEEGKWKKSASHPVLMIAMYYLRLRVALRYLQGTV